MTAPNLARGGNTASRRVLSALVTLALCVAVWFGLDVIRLAVGGSVAGAIALILSAAAFSGFLWRILSGR
jgi:hypothetical protein